MLKRINIIIVLLACVGCNQHARYNNKLFEKMFKVDNFHITDKTKAVVLISDNNCVTCNQMVANFAANKIMDDNILFVISAGGNNIDISPYVNKKRKNILYDTHNELYYSEELKSSTVFLLSQQKIDSVIEINSAAVKEQIGYLNKVL